MTLLLFDVDGTLLQVNGGVRPAVVRAVSAVTDQTVSVDGVSFSGRTDPNIFRDVLRASGVADPNAVLDTVLDHYVEAAQETIRPDHVTPLPGVSTLLSILTARTDVLLGLVTGNVEPIAYHKLRKAGLAEHFSVGVFGSGHRPYGPSPPGRPAGRRLHRTFVPPNPNGRHRRHPPRHPHGPHDRGPSRSRLHWPIRPQRTVGPYPRPPFRKLSGSRGIRRTDPQILIDR